jgi:hypothetical protein
MDETVTYAVLIQAAEDDLEDLRNIAFAAARNIRDGSTEYWEEARGPETAFCFKNWEAAFSFNAYCAKSDIPYRNE